MPRPTIQQISKELSISTTTISFILNGKADNYKISKATQKRVLDYLEKRKFKPNAQARSLSTGKSYTIGYIVPNIADPFFAKIAKGIEDIIAPKGYQIIMASTEEDPDRERDVVRNLLSRRIDGVVVAPTVTAFANLKEIQETGIPLVLFDRKVSQINSHYVGVDNYTAVKTCVSRMHEHEKDRVALITIPAIAETIEHRINGYKDALKERKIRAISSLISTIDPNNLDESLKSEFKRLSRLTPQVTGLFFTNDLTSHQGYLLLERDFPDFLGHLKLATFDDNDYFEFTKPKISGIEQPESYISSNCAQLIMDSIEGKLQEPKQINLETTIRWRM